MDSSKVKQDQRRFQLRRDLQFSEYSVGPGTQLVVKDPIRLEYYLFESFERLLLNLLFNPLTVDELKAAADRKRRPDEATIDEIKAFLKRLLTDNLVVIEGVGAGNMLWAGHERKRKRERMQAMLSLLAIRFRGIQPQNLLDLLNPFTSFLFQPLSFLLAALMFVASLVAVVLNFHLTWESTYLWQQLTSPLTIVLIVAAVMVVKVLHEFGHALACRSIERTCHEMGILLLAFIPCLYCNVSDIWMEPNRWKRMMVSAAGIYVEMLVAAICVPLWMFSTEGPLQVFLFAMITICSVNTLLINGNPLLRYDGYYLFSDLWGVPNLYSESQRRVDQRVYSVFFEGAPRLDWSWLDLYGIASRIYRALILIAILFAIYAFFVRFDLPHVGIGVLVVLAMTTFGAMGAGNVRKVAGCDWNRFKRGRTFGIGLVLSVALVGAMFVPVTTRVYGDGEVGIRESGMIYAPDDGKIVWTVEAGEIVAAGCELGVVRNDNLELAIFEQQQRIRELDLSLNHLEIIQRKTGSDSAAEIEMTRSTLSHAKTMLAELEQQQFDLTIVSPGAGIIQMLPTDRAPLNDSLSLIRNSSTLLNCNQGSFVSSGEPIGVVISQDQQVVNLFVPEKHIRYVNIGDSVEMLVPQYSTEYLHGTVEDVADEQTDSTAKNGPRIVEGTVLVQVNLETDAEEIPMFKSRANGLISGQTVPAYEIMRRLILENFEF